MGRLESVAPHCSPVLSIRPFLLTPLRVALHSRCVYITTGRCSHLDSTKTGELKPANDSNTPARTVPVWILLSASSPRSHTMTTCPSLIPSQPDGTRRRWHRLDLFRSTSRFGLSCVSNVLLSGTTSFLVHDQRSIDECKRQPTKPTLPVAFTHIVCERPPPAITRTKASHSYATGANGMERSGDCPEVHPYLRHGNR